MYHADVVKNVTIPEGDEQAPLHVECWPAWIDHRLVLQKNYACTNANSDFSRRPREAKVHTTSMYCMAHQVYSRNKSPELDLLRTIKTMGHHHPMMLQFR